MSASKEIDAKIASLGDWRGAALAKVRRWIREADPDVVEAVKWRKPSNPAGVPVWEHAGLICTGETYKDKIKRGVPRWWIRRACSIRASPAARAGRSISLKVPSRTGRHSRR